MKIAKMKTGDIPELYRLQLLSFELESNMTGSRDVPALQETEVENRLDFPNLITLKK